MDSFETDLFVIGGGSGGVRAARIAAGHGARVMIAEEYRMGGTCVIRGCVPKKLFAYASHFSHDIADAAGFGWTVPPATFDWATLIANKDKEIARLEAAYTTNVEKSGVQVIKSRAVFEDPHTLVLDGGRRVRSKYILIATGGAPNHGKAIPGNAVLNIDGQSMFGQAPCNSYTSQNNATWPQVSLAGIASTRRACITEGGESAYFAALEQVAQASLSDGDLELRGPAHKMRFTAE